MITGEEALRRLREGNARFVSGETRLRPGAHASLRADILDGQEPFAIVLGCSDSRVPTEIVFDQGLGDLFVIRVAGNVVARSQIGSVEFAAGKFGTPLVVVLGHSRCGAIQATLEEVRREVEARSPNLRSIVDRVRPSIDRLLKENPEGDIDALAPLAVRANVRASVDHLCHGSEVLEELVRRGDLTIVGAEYQLESGVVDFFTAP